MADPGERVPARRPAVALAVGSAVVVVALVIGAGVVVGRWVGDDDSATGSASGPSASPSATVPSAPAATSGPSAAPAPSGTAPTAGLAAYYRQRIRWERCDGRFSCGRLTVPVDYSRPGGATLGLALIRLGATGDRLGSLVVNPGGPGASGVEYVRYADAVVSSAVRRRYDVVGFDPRGVAGSAPLDCLSDRETDAFLAADGSPDDAAEVATLETLAIRLADGCRRANAALLPYVGTRDVARDLDVLRAALGDARLTYLGKSYGTFLGAKYAEQFPRNVARMVLDGALDPRVDERGLLLEQGRGFEQALRAFAADCLAGSGCPLSGSVEDAVGQVATLLDDTDAEPLAAGPRRVPQSLAVLGVVSALYDRDDGWPLLRTALSEMQRGSGTTLLLLADFYADRRPDGRYRSNSNEVIYAVSCLDRRDMGTQAEIEAALPAFREASPVFGAYVAWSALPCGRWPAPPTDTPHPVAAAGSPPILVVGTTRDPATPYVWAQGLADQLAAGVLLTYDGDGHTAYRRGSDCVDAAVDRYLLTGRPPAAGARCS